jgi:uncharacterized membrane protein
MSDPFLPRIIYFFLLATGILDWVRRYPQLPARMASHFGANGVPNNWQSKEAFFFGMAGALSISFVVSFLLPRLINALPVNLINLPNKEYWLAAERREGTSRYMSAMMGWFGCALLFLLLFATSQAINANLPAVGRFDGQAMKMVLVGFLLFTGIWLILLMRHFYRPPQ